MTTTTTTTTTVTNAEGCDAFCGLTFAIRYLAAGAAYGRTGSLVADAPMVEVYDTRYPHTEFGQLVSRYYVDTFRGVDGALSLDMGSPSWTLDAAAVTAAQLWIDALA